MDELNLMDQHITEIARVRRTQTPNNWLSLCDLVQKLQVIFCTTQGVRKMRQIALFP